MGDKSPKNLHKKDEQKHQVKEEKIHEKQVNAEVQHHPHSGHPATDEEEEKPSENAGQDEEAL